MKTVSFPQNAVDAPLLLRKAGKPNSAVACCLLLPGVSLLRQSLVYSGKSYRRYLYVSHLGLTCPLASFPLCFTSSACAISAAAYCCWLCDRQTMLICPAGSGRAIFSQRLALNMQRRRVVLLWWSAETDPQQQFKLKLLETRSLFIAGLKHINIQLWFCPHKRTTIPGTACCPVSLSCVSNK
jgi:hypothetical protein